MNAKIAAGVCLGVLLGGVHAVLAQDASAQVNEADVVLDHVLINIDPFDGGCNMVAVGHAQAPSVDPTHPGFVYPLGPVLCSAVKAAGLRAVKFDMRRVGVLIGDGGVP